MKRILPYLKPYRGKMLLGMLLIAVSSVCSLLLPTIMSDILDGGIYTSDWDYILRCCGRMLLVTLLSLGAVAAGTWCRTQVVSGFCADLRAAVFGRVNALTFEEVSRIGTSALLTRSTHDVGTLAWVADMLSSNIITIPVLFFGGVCCAVIFGGGAQKKLNALMHEQMGDFFRTEWEKTFGPDIHTPEMRIDEPFMKALYLLDGEWETCSVDLRDLDAVRRSYVRSLQEMCCVLDRLKASPALTGAAE